LPVKSGIEWVETSADMIFKFLVALVALMLTICAPGAQEEGRIHITFSKPGYGSGSAYLFYQGQKYGLSVSNTKTGRIWVSTIDLIGTASNFRSVSDILGTYNGADPAAGLVKRAKTVRIENAKGVVLEIRAVNLGRWSTLDLSGMTLKNSGWQPSPE
jgi:hypothetical protein